MLSDVLTDPERPARPAPSPPDSPRSSLKPILVRRSSIDATAARRGVVKRDSACVACAFSLVAAVALTVMFALPQFPFMRNLVCWSCGYRCHYCDPESGHINLDGMGGLVSRVNNRTDIVWKGLERYGVCDADADAEVRAWTTRYGLCTPNGAFRPSAGMYSVLYFLGFGTVFVWVAVFLYLLHQCPTRIIPLRFVPYCMSLTTCAMCWASVAALYTDSLLSAYAGGGELLPSHVNGTRLEFVNVTMTPASESVGVLCLCGTLTFLSFLLLFNCGCECVECCAPDCCDVGCFQMCGAVLYGVMGGLQGLSM